MWWIFLFFLIGILAGFFVNNRTFLIFSEKAVNIMVYFLLFLLGVSTGLNRKLISDLGNIGFEALLLSLGAMFFSFLFSYWWERFVCPKLEHGIKENENNGENKINITGSLYVAFSFLLGIFSGYFFSEKTSFMANDTIVMVTIYILLFFVGSSIGSDRGVLKKIKQISKRALLFPLITVFGTLLGSVLVSLFIKKVNIFDAMAVGSGFGYYSLSSIIIAGLKGDRLATIALVANIIREVFTLLFAPFIYSIFGKFALVSGGGATSMDTTLPVIVKFSDKKTAMISIYHGIVLTILVPFLVSFFCRF